MNIEVDEQIHIPKMSDSIISSYFGKTKVSFVVMLIVIVGIYIGIFMFLNNTKSSNSVGGNYIVFMIEILLWLVLIYVVYINIKKYGDDNVNFQAKMENLFNTKLAELSVNSETNKTTTGGTASDVSGEAKPCVNPDDGMEVFHVANNVFTFDEARDMCDKYNARLANYDEIENAYKNGANWCSYGWSKDQLALFPTQKALYNELKQIPGHENDCGRPGINGGYFKNKNIKFGVNCYGIKPKASQRDIEYTHAINHTPTLTDKQKAAKNLKNKYVVAPFNKDEWSEKAKKAK